MFYFDYHSLQNTHLKQRKHYFCALFNNCFPSNCSTDRDFLLNISLDCVLISIKRYFVSLAQANHIGFWQGQHKNICICGKKERVYVGLTFNLIITNVQRINRVHERYTRKSHVKHYSKEIPFWWQNITVSKNAWQCQGL